MKRPSLHSFSRGELCAACFAAASLGVFFGTVASNPPVVAGVLLVIALWFYAKEPPHGRR